MSSKTDIRMSAYLYRVLCVVAVVVAMLPITCNYIMQGGEIGNWINSVEGIATGVPVHSIQSNLWILMPGLLRRIFGNIVPVYRIWMLFIQVGTAIFAELLFRRVFEKEENKLPVFFGILLYMTCPYRIYICYDLADVAQAVVWMLMPLYLWATWGLLAGKKGIVELVVAAMALAGIGYAEPTFFVIVLGLTFVAGLVARKIWLFAALLGGAVLFAPDLYKLIQYLFLNGYTELNIPIELIMNNGYRFGEFFTAYTWREGHPGMGMGLFICLLTGIWMNFVGSQGSKNAENRGLLALAIGLSVLSLRYFPWDIVQRLGYWALKFVSLPETPAIFWGLACGVFCILGAGYIGKVSKKENKLLAVAVPIIVLLFCVGGCIYQCNTLTFERVPMVFP